MSREFKLIFILCIFIYKNVVAIDLLLETKLGWIQGIQASDSDHAMFLGIPYARVNTTNPFGTAIPVTSFDGVFVADDDTNSCPQDDDIFGGLLGTLDCLRINIHVPPSASLQNRLPVLVWVHGGGFMSWSGRSKLFNPRWLVRHDVIFVSLNYRLNVYGFLCLHTPEVPGNQGLKDQLMALRWINEHIEEFGGDASRITVFGESAGAMSLDTHFVADKERLFSGIILNSGTSLIPEVGTTHNPNAPFKLAELLGFTTNDLSEALSFMASVNPLDLVSASQQISRLYPCVEIEIEGQEAFLLEHPLNLDIPKARDTAILIGFNKDECLICGPNGNPDYYDNFEAFDYLLKIAFNFPDEELTRMIEFMHTFYIGDEIPVSGGEVQIKLGEYEADYKFIWPAERSVDKYIDNGAEKVFYYQFSYDGGRNFLKLRGNVTFPGAAHADELGYLFDIHEDIIHVVNPPLPEDQLIIDRMTTMWTNFVKYGEPTPQATAMLPLKWEPLVDKSQHVFYNIDSELSMGSRPFHDRMSFWELFYRMNWKKQIGYVDDTA